MFKARLRNELKSDTTRFDGLRSERFGRITWYKTEDLWYNIEDLGYFVIEHSIPTLGSA